MTTRDAFLADIIANPEDDAPRMILADWLEENGEPERGEYIRVQCRISELCAWHRAGNPTHPEFDRLLAREAELHPFGAVPYYQWLSSLGIDPSDCVFNRGFVAEITCTAADWLAHADAITASQPIERVTLTTLLPYTAAKRIGRRHDESMEEFLERLWPHITFKLPLAYTNVGINYSSNLTPGTSSVPK